MADEKDPNAKPNETPPPASTAAPARATPPAPAAGRPPAGGQRAISLLFRDLPSGVPASLNLLLSDQGTWSLGTFTERPVGLMVRVPSGASPVSLRQLLVTEKQIQVATANDTSALELQLYVVTNATSATGTVLLPTGASVTIASARDRTNVFGSGSWTIQTGPAVP